MRKSRQNNKPELHTLEADTPPHDMGKLYDNMRVSLLRFASRYFRRPQEIEDVVQEAFVKVIEAQHRRSIEFPEAYLYRATRNLALNAISKRDYKLTSTLGDLMPEGAEFQSPSLEHQFESRQNFEQFCRAVRELPVKCQRVYILRKVYGYSQKEIAERMDISLKTVEAHLTKAILRCSDFIDAENHAEEQRSQPERRQYVR